MCYLLLKMVQEYQTALADAAVATKIAVDTVLKNKKLQEDWESKFGEEEYLVPIPRFLNEVLDVSLGVEDRRYVTSIIDPYNFGCVSPLAYKRFLRIFGDLNRMPKKVKDLCRQAYFQGFWEEKSVMKLLLGEEPGTFLVHLLPGRPDRVALAHVTQNGVRQHRIIVTKEGSVQLDDDRMLQPVPEPPANPSFLHPSKSPRCTSNSASMIKS